MRPRVVVEITGTGTEVGKTFVAARLAGDLIVRGLSVAARKPSQSGAPGAPADSQVLGGATNEARELVCPAHRSYPLAMAPPMAAEALGLQPATIEELLGEIDQRWPAGPVDVGLVEGAGGVASPLASDGDNATLAIRLPADLVILVTDPDLGVINLVRLSCRALEGLPVVVHLNRMDQGNRLHRRNHDWLGEHEGLTVTTSAETLLDAVLGLGKISPRGERVD